MKPRRPTMDRRAPRPHREAAARPGARAGGRRPEGPGHGVRIVHEDSEVIVVDKPHGLLTSNVPGERRDAAFDALKHLARERGGRGARVFIIHRLDKEASGLLVFAKSENAFHSLKEGFRTRRVHRLYLAVVEGEIRGVGEGAAPPSGTIQTYMIDEDEEGLARSVPIGDVAKEGKKMRIARGPRPRPRPTNRPGPPAREEPRLAVTHYRVLGVGRGRSLVQLRLETGRKNQIRVHMKEWGHPIVGDRRYGAASDPIGRLALHAAELGFTNPSTGISARYHTPAPGSFYTAVGMTPPPAAPTAPPAPSPLHPLTSQSRRGDPSPPQDTSWDSVAAWYDDLIGERRSDLYEQVIVPGVQRLLSPAPGLRVLDVACGQGDLCRRLAALGIAPVGIDASGRLIAAARQRTPGGGSPAIRYEVGDALALDDAALGLAEASFDAAACVMALMNINPLDPVCRGVARVLKPGGAFVAVILHPAFRAAGQSSWGWDGPGDAQTRREGRPGGRSDGDDRRYRALPHRRPGGPVRQYRRVDGYLSPGQTPIVMNPGGAAHGNEAVTTITFHRPIQSYVKALGDAGLLITALEEWPSPRVSQPGPRAAEENRLRREIPMFLAFRAIKGGAGPLP